MYIYLEAQYLNQITDLLNPLREILHHFLIAGGGSRLQDGQNLNLVITCICGWLAWCSIVSSRHAVTSHMIMMSNYTRCVIRYGTVCKTQTILNSNFENNRMGNTSGHQIQAMSKYWILSPWLLDTHLYHFWKLFFGGGRGMLSELSWQIQPYNIRFQLFHI